MLSPGGWGEGRGAERQRGTEQRGDNQRREITKVKFVGLGRGLRRPQFHCKTHSEITGVMSELLSLIIIEEGGEDKRTGRLGRFVALEEKVLGCGGGEGYKREGGEKKKVCEIDMLKLTEIGRQRQNKRERRG